MSDNVVSFEADALWQNYLRNWTYWNHVRTLASLISTALFIIGYASHGG